MGFGELLTDNQIGMVYLVGAPIFISLMLVHFYYCWLSVRECRRSRGRKSLLSEAPEAILQVEVY
ncbi:GL23174 [Drosophila persimilis]|uniref:GL23174 n=1 Tax=Drosophila persimilis TaxID=7234 RepID=B4G5F7_DROPE|nr:uncharacterized protein LOC6588212 [Drosophila persimilis]XP_026850687.1 uncharacterized protein LOC6588212 [Drosophila persimilis]EDW24823.1 GL23174 [Drosophila persimilis]